MWLIYAAGAFGQLLLIQDLVRLGLEKKEYKVLAAVSVLNAVAAVIALGAAAGRP